jgi:D-alanyl-D-alanine dipeptidase
VVLVATVLLAGCTQAPVATPAVSPAATTSPPEPSAEVHVTPAPPGFVALSDVDGTILQDIRYASPHNFVGRPIDGYVEPLCVLTRQAAQALHQVQEASRAKGFGVKVYDCYRPLRAGEDLKRWATLPDAQMKTEFFPELSKVDLFTGGYVSNGRSAHSRGSTVDLTLVALPAAPQRAFVPGEPLVPCTAPVGQRFPDNTLDMGTGYDCFDPRSHPADTRISTAAKQNRLLLARLMADAGFRASTTEWWHFTLNGEPNPQEYFDFPVIRAGLR